ncbi:hypothetical protein FM996_18170 [Methylosinus sporium]|uniref:Uncharacterized protein n=1 Tax=Methylosinus sporium TaxID=428 RepID=A0A549SH86_METSR|nr:hypothetical protein [Methylosinus sporium]TRL28999.1 hypothetical protein FM996_18170 [Methylosinus sporium]
MNDQSWIAAVTLRQRLRLWRIRVRSLLQRLRRGLLYGLGRLSKEDAQLIFVDCQSLAGWHPLLILSDDDVLKEINEAFEDDPSLAALVSAACARVSHKWESAGDELYEARRWARNLVEDYARDNDIALLSRESNSGQDDDEQLA